MIVQVNVVLRSNVCDDIDIDCSLIVDITISSRSFVISQSYVPISASLSNISDLAVAALIL